MEDQLGYRLFDLDPDVIDLGYDVFGFLGVKGANYIDLGGILVGSTVYGLCFMLV